MSDIGELLEQLHNDTQRALDNLTIEELEDQFPCELLSPKCSKNPINWWCLCRHCGAALRSCENCKAVTDLVRAELDDFNTMCCHVAGNNWDDLWQFVPIGAVS